MIIFTQYIRYSMFKISLYRVRDWLAGSPRNRVSLVGVHFASTVSPVTRNLLWHAISIFFYSIDVQHLIHVHVATIYCECCVIHSRCTVLQEVLQLANSNCELAVWLRIWKFKAFLSNRGVWCYSCITLFKQDSATLFPELLPAQNLWPNGEGWDQWLTKGVLAPTSKLLLIL